MRRRHKTTLGPALLALLLLATGIALIILYGFVRLLAPVGTSSYAQFQEDSMRFPTTTGYNLNRQKVSLPADFSTELTITIIAFERWQQSLVDSWLPFVKTLETEYPNLTYYELPTIRPMNFLSRTFINEGMRMGIPDRMARERTVTLYLEKEPFKRSLNIADESTITLQLLDRNGELLWQTTGKFRPEQGRDLATAISSRPETVPQNNTATSF